VEEGREILLREQHIGGIAAYLADLDVRGDDGVLILERPERERAVLPGVVLVGGLLPVFRAVSQRGDVHGQEVLDDNPVQFERAAIGWRIAVPTTHARADFVLVAESGAGHAGIREPGWRAEAEQERVRPALDVDAIGVVAVERDVRLEEVTRAIRRRQSADARRAVGIAARAAGAGFAAEIVPGAGVVAQDAADLGARGSVLVVY
jgi:hypothetical protein